MANAQFKAWDKKRSVMIHNVAVYPGGGVGFFIDDAKEAYGEKFDAFDDDMFQNDPEWFILDNDVVQLQCSDCQDKNGNNVWKGDIIKSDITGLCYVVAFKNGSFNAHAGQIYCPPSMWNTCEVIGNIYEHPERLGVPVADQM